MVKLFDKLAQTNFLQKLIKKAWFSLESYNMRQNCN